MSKLKIIICSICVYATILPTNISGELSKFQYNVIELAFTNGFLEGMSIDEKTINKLLKDKQSLKDFARKAAREYMDTVVKLNSTDQKENSKEKEPGKAGNSIAF